MKPIFKAITITWLILQMPKEKVKDLYYGDVVPVNEEYSIQIWAMSDPKEDTLIIYHHPKSPNK